MQKKKQTKIQKDKKEIAIKENYQLSKNNFLPTVIPKESKKFLLPKKRIFQLSHYLANKINNFGQEKSLFWKRKFSPSLLFLYLLLLVIIVVTIFSSIFFGYYLPHHQNNIPPNYPIPVDSKKIKSDAILAIRNYYNDNNLIIKKISNPFASNDNYFFDSQSLNVKFINDITNIYSILYVADDAKVYINNSDKPIQYYIQAYLIFNDDNKKFYFVDYKKFNYNAFDINKLPLSGWKIVSLWLKNIPKTTDTWFYNNDDNFAGKLGYLSVNKVDDDHTGAIIPMGYFGNYIPYLTPYYPFNLITANNLNVKYDKWLAIYQNKYAVWYNPFAREVLSKITVSFDDDNFVIYHIQIKVPMLLTLLPKGNTVDWSKENLFTPGSPVYYQITLSYQNVWNYGSFFIAKNDLHWKLSN